MREMLSIVGATGRWFWWRIVFEIPGQIWRAIWPIANPGSEITLKWPRLCPMTQQLAGLRTVLIHFSCLPTTSSL